MVFRSVRRALAALIVFGSLLCLPPAQALPSADAANQALDRQFLDCFMRRDVDGLMRCYWKSPELFAVFADGTPLQGWDSVRRAYASFFAGLSAIQIDGSDVSYVPAGNGRAGTGLLRAVLTTKDGVKEPFVVRFTDVRAQEDGHWVYVMDHQAAVMLAADDKPTDSLYKRLGGYDAIAAVTDEVITNLIADPQLHKFFGGVSASSGKRIRQLFVDQLVALTGGPAVYIGRDMKTSHQGLGITDSDWDRTVQILTAALDKYKVQEREKGELLALIGPLKADIVQQK